MNKLQKMREANKNVQKVVMSSRSLDAVRYNIHNSKAHEKKKAEICLDAQMKGFVYISEAKFKDGSGICDVYLPELDIAIEILDSETNARFNKKKYPVKQIIPVRTNEEFTL